MLNKAGEIIKRFRGNLKAYLCSLKPKAKDLLKKTEASYSYIALKTKNLYKNALEGSKLLLNKLITFYKKLNIEKKFKKAFLAVKNYNYKNLRSDIISLYNKLKDSVIDKIGSEKNVSFVSDLSFRAISASATFVLLFFFVSAAFASNLDFGYRVICNNKTVAVASTRATAIKAYEEASKELKALDISKEPVVKIAFTIANKEFLNNEACTKNAIIAAYDGREGAYGIYADGVLIVALDTKEEAETLLDEYKKEFNKEGVLEISFNKKVEVLQARVEKGSVKTKEDANKVLRQPAGGVKVHEVREGETISEIAENAGTTTKKILQLNPGVKIETLQIGTKLNVSDNTPVIAVRTKEHSKELEKIAYETNKVEDKNTYKGITIIVSDGVYGEKEVDYEVYKENGVVTTKIATNENILKEPVTKQVKVGSKARPATASTGKFMNPFSAGVVTSRYGSRSRGFHTGIDLAGKTGSAVYAADGGTVTFAGWSGGYGKVIKIRHDNGYETYYAHLSSINVGVGTKVAKGEFIGRVGNTGNSTGPHLHFEIRINGNSVNPGSYIGR